MSGDQYFRHNLHYGHTIWHLRPRTLDFFKIPTPISVKFTITACMHLTLCVQSYTDNLLCFSLPLYMRGNPGGGRDRSIEVLTRPSNPEAAATGSFTSTGRFSVLTTSRPVAPLSPSGAGAAAGGACWGTLAFRAGRAVLSASVAAVEPATAARALRGSLASAAARTAASMRATFRSTS